MIPEDGNYELLKAAIETCPAQPSHWQPLLLERFSTFMSSVRWLSMTEGRVKEQRIYVAYADGCATGGGAIKLRVAEEVSKLGGWLFDWNAAPGHEVIFNFGIALPRLLDSEGVVRVYPHLDDE